MDLDDEELRATRIMNGANKSLGYLYKLEQRIKELEKIEEEHKKENGELRERVKELEGKLEKQKEINTIINKENIDDKYEELGQNYYFGSNNVERAKERRDKMYNEIVEQLGR